MARRVAHEVDLLVPCQQLECELLRIDREGLQGKHVLEDGRQLPAQANDGRSALDLVEHKPHVLDSCLDLVAERQPRRKVPILRPFELKHALSLTRHRVLRLYPRVRLEVDAFHGVLHPRSLQQDVCLEALCDQVDLHEALDFQPHTNLCALLLLCILLFLRRHRPTAILINASTRLNGAVLAGTLVLVRADAKFGMGKCCILNQNTYRMHTLGSCADQVGARCVLRPVEPLDGKAA